MENNLKNAVKKQQFNYFPLFHFFTFSEKRKTGKKWKHFAESAVKTAFLIISTFSTFPHFHSKI